MNKKYMEVCFELLNFKSLKPENILKCIFNLNDTINIKYDKVELYVCKDYWQNGWLKSDVLKKIKSIYLNNICVDSKYLNESNDFLLELKIKNEIVLDISFAPKFNSDLNIYGYSLCIYREGELFDQSLILKLSECVKKYTNSRDEIKLIKNLNPIINNSDSIKVVFSNF